MGSHISEAEDPLFETVTLFFSVTENQNLKCLRPVVVDLTTVYVGDARVMRMHNEGIIVEPIRQS